MYNLIKILNEFNKSFNPYLDGKAILEEAFLKNKNWRKQTEYLSFYIEDEFRIFSGLKNFKLDGFNSDMDYFCDNLPCDIKLHNINDKKGTVLLNDKYFTDYCFDEYSKILLIVFSGDLKIDEDGSFKKFHDNLKGISKYMEKSKNENKKSRKRKTGGDILNCSLYLIYDKGVLNIHNQGKNSNDNKRNPKYEALLKSLEKYKIYSYDF